MPLRDGEVQRNTLSEPRGVICFEADVPVDEMGRSYMIGQVSHPVQNAGQGTAKDCLVLTHQPPTTCKHASSSATVRQIQSGTCLDIAL